MQVPGLLVVELAKTPVVVQVILRPEDMELGED